MGFVDDSERDRRGVVPAAQLRLPARRGRGHRRDGQLRLPARAGRDEPGLREERRPAGAPSLAGGAQGGPQLRDQRAAARDDGGRHRARGRGSPSRRVAGMSRSRSGCDPTSRWTTSSWCRMAEWSGTSRSPPIAGPPPPPSGSRWTGADGCCFGRGATRPTYPDPGRVPLRHDEPRLSHCRRQADALARGRPLLHELDRPHAQPRSRLTETGTPTPSGRRRWTCWCRPARSTSGEVGSSTYLPQEPSVTTYARRLGLFSGTMAVVGGIVGGGIFRTPAAVAERVGSSGLILGVWVAGGAGGARGCALLRRAGSSPSPRGRGLRLPPGDLGTAGRVSLRLGVAPGHRQRSDRRDRGDLRRLHPCPHRPAASARPAAGDRRHRAGVRDQLLRRAPRGGRPERVYGAQAARAGRAGRRRTPGRAAAV